MSYLQDGFGGYLALFLAGYLATELWRWLGMLIGARLDLGGAPFEWVRAVATGLVAGLVARMVIFPAGALAGVPMVELPPPAALSTRPRARGRRTSAASRRRSRR